MAGHYKHASILADIIIKSVQASFALELCGDSIKAIQTLEKLLQRKLLDSSH